MNELWADSAIPAQQWEVVKPELAEIAKGNVMPPYRQFFACLDRVAVPGMSVLDVGAGCGHYGEAMRLTGRRNWLDYVAVDSSEAFKALAAREFPYLRYDIGAASDLPYANASFSFTLSSACLMYAADPLKDIRELARVSSGYVILHRTPIAVNRKTYQVDQVAYGRTFLETRFAESDILAMCETAGLSVFHVETIFERADLAHKTYLLKKEPVFPISV